MITKNKIVILGNEWVTKSCIQVAGATEEADFFFFLMRWKNKTPSKV